MYVGVWRQRQRPHEKNLELCLVTNGAFMTEAQQKGGQQSAGAVGDRLNLMHTNF